MKKTRVLFVCLGNICRSPTAQGIFEKLIKDKGLTDFFEVDSAGTSAYHIGSLPDGRSINAAHKRGYDLTTQRARKVSFDDFEEFDLILAADRSNLADMLEIAPHSARNKLKLILDYSKLAKGHDVPDPYYGGDAGFERVLDLLEDACMEIIKSAQ